MVNPPKVILHFFRSITNIRRDKEVSKWQFSKDSKTNLSTIFDLLTSKKISTLIHTRVKERTNLNYLGPPKIEVQTLEFFQVNELFCLAFELLVLTLFPNCIFPIIIYFNFVENMKSVVDFYSYWLVEHSRSSLKV